MRVGIVGIGTESSTFAPHRTGLDDFDRFRGADLEDRYPFLRGWRLPGIDIDFVPLFVARALPGGPVLPEAYEALETELLERLRAALPLDGVVIDLHGAMNVVGRDDIETSLVRRIRDAIGDHALLSVSEDLHGQVSRELVETVDLITAYRTAPHVDTVETRERACQNLARCLLEGIRPMRAFVRVPVLLPGERTSTRDQPATSIYASVAESARRRRMLDAAIWVGYAWADEPRSAASVVTTGTDAQTIRAEAEGLARAFWEARKDFAFCAPAGSGTWCVERALDSAARPFLVSDSGDNPTAGGSGDGAWLLADLLGNPELASGRRTAIWTSCVEPAGVATCVRAGVGREVEVSVGGVYGGGPAVSLRGTVAAVERDDPVGGDLAVVRSGGVSAVLTSQRKPFHHIRDLTALGLDPAVQDVTAVKLGYLTPDLHNAAADWALALTPGAVDQDLPRLPYQRATRPMYPLDPDLAEPDLTPVLLT